jgi:hypothetical protein
MADEDDEIALTAGFDPQNAEAVLGVVEGDALDKPGQNFVEVIVLGPSGMDP